MEDVFVQYLGTDRLAVPAPRAPQPAGVRHGAGALAARRRLAFKSDADLLRVAGTLFEFRRGVGAATDEAEYRVDRQTARAATRSLHASIAATPKGLHLSAVLNSRCGTGAEREVVLALCLSALAMGPRIADVADLMRALGQDAGDGLTVMRAIAAGSRLAARGIVDVEDDEEADLSAAAIGVTTAVVAPLLARRRGSQSRWGAKSYQKFLYSMRIVVEAVFALDVTHYSCDTGVDYRGRRRPVARARRLIGEARAAAARHPEWPVNEIFTSGFNDVEVRLLLMLLGKEYDFGVGDGELYRGQALARCASEDHGMTRQVLAVLRGRSRLRAEGYVGTVGGGEALVGQEDEQTLRSTEFELSETFRDRLKVTRARPANSGGRRPIVRMTQLVLHESVRRALEMVAAQAEHAKILLHDWGLARRVAYGRGVTALFYGPPGTGKTASAEAIAHRLGRRILVADYGRLQSCWVGDTEKNIARIFGDATRDGAVLFWDEADAMFYDRDDAARTWEVRDVNVLLHEIERFEGLCILSTNRHATLDKAFERRLSLKVEFAPPDRAMRLEIWRRLVPRSMPLAGDVDVAALAQHDLTGGEIKNVVMNAARLAICRGPDARVTAADFDQAVKMECEGRWSAKGRMGFVRAGGE